MPLYQPGSVEQTREDNYWSNYFVSHQQRSQEALLDLYNYTQERGVFDASAFRGQIAALPKMAAEQNPINQNAFVQGYTLTRLNKIESRLADLESRVIS